MEIVEGWDEIVVLDRFLPGDCRIYLVGKEVVIFSVTIHELGHALRLRHSTDSNAVMFPTYSGPRHELGEDGIAGIQSIYGKRSEKPMGGLYGWQRFLHWIRDLFR